MNWEHVEANRTQVEQWSRRIDDNLRAADEHRKPLKGSRRSTRPRQRIDSAYHREAHHAGSDQYRPQHCGG
jgi:hypothetical protein